MDTQMEQGPCHSSAEALLNDISQNPHLLPARYDWKGERRPYSKEELATLYKNIDADHLPKLLSKLIVHTDAQIPPLVPGNRSLLATGVNSLLRNRTETEHLRRNRGSIAGHGLVQAVFNTRGSSHSGRFALEYLRAKELRGSLVRAPTLPPFVPNLFQELVIMNGHRFATFCLAFDKTNNRVITGSDDYLVKIWSTQSGYLLFTLRGHAAVVTFMDISPDNSMLVTASDDGIVRVWDLKSSAPIAVLPTGNQPRSRKPITTVAFSPSPIPQIRYLIATSMDGYTWVWKYDRDTKRFQAKPTMLDCKTFNDSQLKFSTFNPTGSQFAVAGRDLFIRVFSTIQGGPEAIKAGKRRKSYDKSKAGTAEGTATELPPATSSSSPVVEPSSPVNSGQQNWGEPVLIAQLDGHAGEVTNLSYSRFGNRLLSGSADGTVRIWKYDPQSKMWTSMAIDVRDEHNQAEATITAAKRMLPSPVVGSATPNPFLIPSESTGTTNDDTAMAEPTTNGSAATVQSQVGETTVEASTRAVPALGDNARIVPTMAVWSLDDSTVILTTSLGEVKIFDSTTGEWIRTIKGHARGSAIYVVDVHPLDNRIVLTAGYDGQVILWDVVKGVKIKSWSYPNHEFLDGRFSSDGLMFAVTEQEGTCLLFGAGKNPDDYRDARTFVEQTFWSDYGPVRYDADHNVVDDTTQIAPHLMDRTPILDNNGRDYAKQKGPRYGLDLPVAAPPGVLEQEEAIKLQLLEEELENLAEQTLAVIPATDKRKLYKRRREFILEDDDDDDDPMTTEVPIVPLPNESSGEEYAGGVVSASSSSDNESDDSDVGPDGEGLPAAAFVVNDDDDDDDYFSGGQVQRKRRAASSSGTPKKQRATDKRRKSGRSRKRQRLRDSDDEDDLDIDDEEDSDMYDIPRTPTRKGKNGLIRGLPSGSKSQRSARPKSFANDDYPSDEMLESSAEEGDNESQFSGSSAAGSSLAIPQFTPSSSIPSSPKKKKQWRGNGRKKGKAVLRDEKAIELQRWLPSDWIKTNEPRKAPYHPQIGDYVAYFRQGHEFYWRETPLRSKLNEKVIPFKKDPSLHWATFGRVSRITYNVGPPTWCTITLEEQILSSPWGFPADPNFVPSRRRFEVEFHDLGDVPDFIVLYTVFQEGVNSQYGKGDMIWASFDGGVYCGTITDQVVEDESFPESLWMAFEVTWPANEATNLSPWEMQREEAEDHSHEESIPADEMERIQEVLEHLLQMEEFSIFKYAVDFEAYPDYCKAIAYPICLDDIQERLTSGFYRRARSIQFDVELLEQNALTYNDPKSGIALFAKHLTRIFKTSVANPSKPLPEHIHVKTSRKDEDDEFDGSGSENSQVDIESEPEPELVDEDEDAEDDQAFLDDESSNDDHRSSTRSRSRTQRTNTGRSSRTGRKSNPFSSPSRASRSRQNSGKATATNGRTKPAGQRRAKKKKNEDDDDDDDGEWGKPSAGSSRGRARQSRKKEDEDDDGDFEEDEVEAGLDREEYLDDEDDFQQETYSSSSSARPSRVGRKKQKIVESDEDYV